MAGAAPQRSAFRWATILVPALWLGVFFLFPFLLVAKIALSDPALARPPYTPTIDWAAGWAGITAFLGALDLDSFARLTRDALYLDAFLSSVRIATVSTVILLLVGYPIAYGMARAPHGWRPVLVALVILPFWTSFLIRVYAWIGILRPEGLLNLFLQAVGLQDPAAPLALLNTNTAVYVGIVYSYLPFMVLPLYAALERMDETLLEAAADLGCPPWKAFWLVTLPISLPGVIAGCMLCFIPAMGEFVIPDLLGGAETLMIGRVIWIEFFANRDWPAASAVAVALLAVLIAPIVLYQRAVQKQLEAGR